MKFSEQWLREWVNPELTTEELSEQLSMAGLEVDGVEPVAPDFYGVVVGEVVECGQHPNADKLQVTKVNIGTDELLDIVCGASNCRTGLKVAVATVGAVLPGDFKIKKSKLRGEPSHGMLCSVSELGLAEESEGIWELPQDAPLGQDIRQWLGLDDVTIDVDLTPNRADCLGVRGVAREVGVLNNLDVTEPVIEPAPVTHQDSLPIELLAPEACSRYLGRVVHGVNVQAESPLWLQEKLRRSGVRSIDPVVDVTNYVLLELGHPMHAFDYDALVGGIQVRFAKEQEKLTLLDGQEVILTPDILVIADHEKSLAMAGIFGGLDSGVSAETKTILLESAFFHPDAILGKARQYGLHTDASHRYERGVDPELQEQAMERATELILAICGGEAGPIVEAVSEEHLPKAQSISLRRSRLQRVLGVDIEIEQVTAMMARLGFQVDYQTDSASWQVTVPPYRFDLSIEEDLIEEVARIYGYNQLPAHAPLAHLNMHRDPETQIKLPALKDRLTALGYQEVITYSFVDPKHQALLYPDTAPLNLPHPISVDMSSMRLGLLPGLLTAASYNQKRQQTQLRLFESGLKFTPDEQAENGIAQEQVLGGVLTGTQYDEHWLQGNTALNFYDVKGHVEAVLALSNQASQYHFVPSENPALHPGQGADIYDGERYIGFCGTLHPKFQKPFGLRHQAFIFELLVDAISIQQVPSIQPVSKYPLIRRDLAIIVDKTLMANELLTMIKKASLKYLVDVRLFDVYHGAPLADDKQSFAMKLIIQAPDKTLEDAQVNQLVEQVLSLLETEYQAVLREG